MDARQTASGALASRDPVDRGFEDMAVGRLFVAPVRWLFERAAALERRWIAWLGGESLGDRR